MKLALTWQMYALGSAFFAALTALLAKVGVRDVDANLATAIRTVVILAFAWSVALLGGACKNLPELNPRTWLFLVLSGLATGASWLCYFHALKMGPASRVAPLDKLSVPLAVLLAVLLLHEPLGWKALLGVVLITAGAGLLWNS